MFKKLKNGLSDLSWTLAGTALVLITLSGQTRTYGLWISGIALTVYFFGILISSDDDE
jgi:hypothetical protein